MTTMSHAAVLRSVRRSIRVGWVLFLAMLYLAGARPAAAAVTSRALPAVGQVVAANGGEEIRFVDAAAWQVVDVAQDLLPGDVLRTGPHGLLAILFRDETQVRLHRNSVMQIKEIGAKGSSVGSLLRLDIGGIWSRARPVADGLQIETPAATAAIRGTDWALSVGADGTSTLVVLSGRVEFFNDQGRVTVERGEQASARVGQPPVKRYLIDPRDKPRWSLYLDVEWIQMLSLTGERLADLRARQAAQDLPALESGGGPGALLAAGEVAYDRGDIAEAERLLRLAQAKGAGTGGRERLLEGMIALRQRAYARAREVLQQARTEAGGRTAMLVELGLMGVAVETKDTATAEQSLAAAERAFPEAPEPALARAWFLSFAGAHQEALAVSQRAADRFPQEASLQFLLGHLYQLSGNTAEEYQALNRAIALDDGYYLAWNWLGLYYHVNAPDAVKAREAYERALLVNPNYYASWNNLGNLALQLGDYARSEAHYKRAIAAAPHAALPWAGYAYMLMLAERSREADTAIGKAAELDPADPSVLLARGHMALLGGDPQAAIEWMLKAVVADPALPGGNTQLAIAYYQAGRVEDAKRELALASRIDPKDPLPPLIGSVIAQDRAEAGEAIRLAQEGFDKYQASSFFNVEGLASTRGGLLNLGSAYANLSLADWGAFYTDLSASPYIADSYFARAATFPSEAARQGAIAQGFLLDPTAVSAPTRYFQFLREPEIDPVIGGTVGSNDGDLTWSGNASIQGFSRFGSALAYSLFASHNDDSGFRKNAGRETTSVGVNLGYRADEANSLLFRSSFYKNDAGSPRNIQDEQADDSTELQYAWINVGYQHRFDFNNRIIAQASYANLKSKFDNDNSIYKFLSPIDLSIFSLSNLDVLSFFHGFGIYDATQALGKPSNLPEISFFPIIEVDDEFVFIPPVSNSIPSDPDLSPSARLREKTNDVLLQFRHLFDLEDASFTYGAEWQAGESDLKFDNYVGQPIGTLTFRESGLQIPFVRSDRQGSHLDLERQVGQGYVRATWNATPALTLEGGLAFRRYDDISDKSSSYLDPAVGAAWRIGRDHWLRAAYQQDQNLGLISGSLAPVATLGLAAPDAFGQASVFTQSAAGSRTADLSLRWDAQWTRHLFTFLQAEHQTFDNTTVNVDWFGGFVQLPRGERNALSAGGNVWFLERFGAFGTLTLQDTEAHVSGPGSDPNMPLLPGYIARAGLTWVHPWQIRVSLSENFVGDRPSNLAPHDDLDSYRTTDLTASWQPFEKHVLVSMALLNIFDDDYEVAAGFPAPGRTVLFGLDYRF